MTSEKGLQNLDIIRVVAMLLIILDHYMCTCGNEVITSIGLYLGRIAVSIFFSMSAFVYGIKWKKNNYKHFDIKTFTHSRFIRIIIPLWIVLILIIAIEYALYHYFDITTIIFNFFGLGWFRPFLSAGHLWFITMILIIYVALIVFSHFRFDDSHPLFWWVSLVLLAVFYIVFARDIPKLGYSWIPLELWTAGLLFYKGDILVKWIDKNHKIFGAIPLVIFSILLFISIKYPQLHNVNYPFLLFSAGLTGLLLFLSSLCSTIPLSQNKKIHILAKRSYEIYLVHLPLLILLSRYINSQWILIPLWFTTTYIVALGINFLCLGISKRTQ